MPPLLDDANRRLLLAIQRDARAPLTALAAETGLSPQATAERLRRLEAGGVIRGYRADVDPEALGLPLSAFVRVVASGEEAAGLPAVARTLPNVIECHRLTGVDSFILRVVARSVAELEQVVDRLLPFGQVTTSLVLSSTIPPRPLPL